MLAVLAGCVLSAPRPNNKKSGNGTTFFNIGQNYFDEWQAFATGTGITPAGISVYGDIYSGALNSDSVNLLSSYAAAHRYVDSYLV